MKYNKTKKKTNITKNHEDAKAYKLSPELELYTFVCTNSLRDKFYESESESLSRLCNLLKTVNPEFAAKLTIYAREQMHLRSIPIIITIELSRLYKGNSWVSKLIERIIQRPDEITEILACYQFVNNRTGTKKLNKLSNQIKLGIKKVFESDKFDEYQYSKYNRKTEIRLRDALFLSHPKPQNDDQKKLFDAIANDTLKIAYTWETQMSEAGKSDSPITSKKVVWEEMINSRKMGYMATLRNLRNFLENGVSEECIKKVCDYLSNPVAVMNSKQLPFRFLSAYRMLTGNKIRVFGWGFDNSSKEVSSPYLGMVLDALEEAIKHSINNIPMFNNDNILIATDVSGSMQQPISKCSVITMYDIGTVLAMMMHSKCKKAVTGMFGDVWKVVTFPKNDILRNVDEIHRREGEVGYSTNGYKVLDWAIKKSNKYTFDKIMLFTDCQLYGDRLGSDIIDKWNTYKNLNPNTKLYIFDLSGYGTAPLNVKSNDVFLISGWSNKIFNVLELFENNKDTTEIINSIEFDM